MERGRYLWLLLSSCGVIKPGLRVLHVAPEPFMLDWLGKEIGEGYHACDFEPNRYRHRDVPIYAFDFCRDLFRFPSSLFDLMVHNHVLEHVPCNVESVLQECVRVLKPGGRMFFSVPFRKGLTDEDLAEDLSDEERVRRFGQNDHFRIFGTEDFPELLQRVFGQDLLANVRDLVDEADLNRARVPNAARSVYSGHTILMYRRPFSTLALLSH